MKFILLFMAGLMSIGCLAEPLKFKGWKEQQILEAQNEVLRLSVHLRQVRTNPKSFEVPMAEKDLKRAQENLEITKELSFEDYADVYVTPLQHDSAQFSKLMDSLSKEELLQLTRILIKNKTPDSDAEHDEVPEPPVLMSSSTHS